MVDKVLIGDVFSQVDTNCEETNYLDKYIGDGELLYMMSGRCGINIVLEDIIKTMNRPLKAYIPLYTCETVVAPFKKNNCEIIYYDVDKNLKPILEEESIENCDVMLICGYFGFVRYDVESVKYAKSLGKIVIEDATHSVFSSGGMSPYVVYIAGSLRKWINVDSGGFALKRNGKFVAKQKEFSDEHLKLRHNIEKFGHSDPELARKYFWQAEYMLRDIFDSQKSDDNSIYTMKHMDVERIIDKRRTNYKYLYDKINNELVHAIFELKEGDVPSHFTIFVKERDKFFDYILKNNIQPKIFWPAHNTEKELENKEAQYIYENILSLPCDQRYSEKEMSYVAEIVNSFRV